VALLTSVILVGRWESQLLTPALSSRVIRRSRSVKQILLIIGAGLIVGGCCSTDIQQAPTSDLQVRRYELKHDLNREVTWNYPSLQSDAFDDVRDELAEKEAIEREISRRGVTAYYRPSSFVYWDNRLTSEK
jgi:hypothetical protein